KTRVVSMPPSVRNSEPASWGRRSTAAWLPATPTRGKRHLRRERTELAALELRRQQAADAVLREDGEERRAEVAVRQLRALVEVPELLVRPRRIGVMIGVPREADQGIKREPRVGVPRVDRPDAARGPREAPVLEVVDGLEEPDREHRLQDEDREGARPERDQNRERAAPLEREPVHDAALEQARV